MSIVQKLGLMLLSALMLFVLSACGSSQIKARKELRDREAQESHLYCDFVNGETYPDVDVAVNLEMAKHCDSEGPLTISGYRSPSEAIGIVYCCRLRDDMSINKESKSGKKK